MVALIHRSWRQAAEFHATGRWTSDTVPGLLSARAERDPSGVAYIEGDQVTTWSELVAAAAGLGEDLLGRGVRAGDIVLVVLKDGPELVAAMAAIQGIAAVAAPLGHATGAGEVSAVANRTRATVVLTDRYIDLDLGVTEVIELPRISQWRVGKASLPLPGVSLDADDVSDVMFTSGTTGRPKGVINSANTKLAGVRGLLEEHPMWADDVFGVMPPLSHNAGWLFTAVPAIAVGGTLVAIGRGDSEAMLDRLEKHGVTVVFMVPTHMRDLVTTYRQHPGRWNLKLRLIMTGAAPSQADMMEAAIADWGVTIVSIYGMIECQGVTFTRADDDMTTISATVGRACPGAVVALRDPQTHSVIEGEGVVGEVVTAGALNFLGYYEDEAATRSTLTRDGWLLTGDLGQWADGSLQIVGRRKEVILRGGLTLTPSEIEACFADLPGVGEVVAVGLPNERLGERVCLVATGELPTRDDLRAHLEVRGLGRQLLPDDIHRIDAIPRTDLGKPKRAEVRARIMARIAEHAGVEGA